MEIALSTTEAEYIPLSACARELTPLRAILSEIIKCGPAHQQMENLPTNHCTTVTTKTLLTHKGKTGPSIVYEDNAGCLVLATEPDQNRPRTKHVGIKYHHHFRDQVRLGRLKVTKIPTALNWADIFTKPLVHVKFVALHKMLMGW